MSSASPKARLSLWRHLNAREVLEALQIHGPLSRAEIVRRTGLSSPTVTRTVSALIESRLLEEGEFRQAALGRPGKVLRLASRAVSVLGAAVGVRTCEVVSAGLDGAIQPEHVRTFPTPARYSDLVETIVRKSRELMSEAATTVLGLGVSMPGLLNRRQRRTLVSPNLHQTDGQRLGEDLADRLQLDVALLQESHALCLAERTYGAAKEIDDFAMLDISEGLGLGVVQGGHLVMGHSGLAGELGHVTVELNGQPCGCGNRGCLETVATDTALAAAVSERMGRKVTIEEVVELGQAGKLEAAEEIERVLQYLTVGVAAVINLFNPNKLFIYGCLLDVSADLFDQVLEQTRARALAPSMADCEIIRARGNKQLGAVAGIIHRLTTGREEVLV
jgi:N-acetylglucosamine repressor